MAEEKRMPFIDTFERIGMERGLRKGLNQGRLEDIETILEARFPAAASELMLEIRQVRDHEQLKKIVLAAATVSTADELRKLWANGSNCEPPQE